MAGNDSTHLIRKNELIEYSSRPNYRVRLFYRAKLSLSLEMAGDGFLRQNRQIDRFYVSLDWSPGEPHYLKSGEWIGIQEEGRMGFQPRRLTLEAEP